MGYIDKAKQSLGARPAMAGEPPASDGRRASEISLALEQARRLAWVQS